MNPFVQNIRLDVIQVNTSWKLSSNKNDGQPITSINVPIPYFIDDVKSTGIYHHRQSKHALFTRIKSIGRDVLLYITLTLKKDKDYIEISNNETCIEMGISRASLYNGLAQLVEAGIIAKRDVRSYWINPIYIFNGNRVNYFKNLGDEYVNVIAQVVG